MSTKRRDPRESPYAASARDTKGPSPIGSRYKIIQEGAGEGGFGRIDRAQDQELDRFVALKHLDPLFKDNPSEADIERFRREARTLAKVSHPNIPAIYDIRIDEEARQFTIIFEWIDGLTIRQFLVDRGTMSLEQVRRWLLQVCSALGRAHELGIIHRDLKPSNLIITADLATCYLVDFGIALRKADLSRLTDASPIGTPGYMSPEQEASEDLGPESDIFSLGIVLYECLAGSKPTVGGYRPLSVINESIPPSVDELIRACLAERGQRLKSAAEFAERLERALTPNPSLPDTLASGSLHEVRAALSNMKPQDFTQLPVGQKVLIKSRLAGLIDANLEHMVTAIASLLTELVRVAFEGRPADYRYYVDQAMEYGFEVQYGERWQGNQQLRQAINEVVLSCPGEAHRIVADALLAFLDARQSRPDEESWYYNGLRILMQHLLANPHCGETHAETLANLLPVIEEKARRA